jgi:hypothetical protein
MRQGPALLACAFYVPQAWTNTRALTARGDAREASLCHEAPGGSPDAQDYNGSTKVVTRCKYEGFDGVRAGQIEEDAIFGRLDLWGDFKEGEDDGRGLGLR